jgi:hypothetical protein
MYWSKNRQKFLFEFNWINTFEVQKYRFIACRFQPRSWWTISSSHCFNTNQMRIEFNEALNFEAKLVQLRRGCHCSVVDCSVVSDSYLVFGCHSLCSWFIPNSDYSSPNIFFIYPKIRIRFQLKSWVNKKILRGKLLLIYNYCYFYNIFNLTSIVINKR